MSIESNPALASLEIYSESLHAPANFWRHITTHDYIRYRETAPGLEHTKSFLNDPVLIGRQINHAIGNHYIDRVVGQGDTLYFAFEEFNIFNTSLALIFTRQSEHFIGHVEAIGFPRGTDAFRRQENVNSPA